MLHSLLWFLLWNTIPIHALIPQHLDFELPFLEDQNISISFTVDEKKFLDNLQEDLSWSVDTQIFSDKVMPLKEKIMFSDLFSLKFYASKLFHLKSMVLYQNNDREVKIFSKWQIKNLVFYHKDLDPILFFSDKNTIYYQFLTKNKTYLEYAEFPWLDRTLVTQPLSYKECLWMGGKITAQEKLHIDETMICQYNNVSFLTKYPNSHNWNWYLYEEYFFGLENQIEFLSWKNFPKNEISSYIELFFVSEDKREYRDINPKLSDLWFVKDNPILYHKGWYVQQQDLQDGRMPLVLNYNEYEKFFFMLDRWDIEWEQEYPNFSISYKYLGSASDSADLYQFDGNIDIPQSLLIWWKQYFLQSSFIKNESPSASWADPSIALIPKRTTTWREWWDKKNSSRELYEYLWSFSKNAKLNFSNKTTSIKNYTLNFSEYPDMYFLYRRK